MTRSLRTVAEARSQWPSRLRRALLSCLVQVRLLLDGDR
jgi:hypothetical protein